MIKTGKKNQAIPPDTRGFQPGIIIGAEIAFAALLLYMANKPVDLSPTAQAPQEALISIQIPVANAAVASTANLGVN